MTAASVRKAQVTNLTSSYPYRYILDHVDLVYNSKSRDYLINFHKIIENQGREPLSSIYARIMVCAFPADPELAAWRHRECPISLDSLQFEAYAADKTPLKATVIHQEASNIEMLIWLEDQKTGRTFPLEQGCRTQVDYRIIIPYDLWGPFLLRHVRGPCQKLSVTLRFPKGTARVWCNMLGIENPWAAVDPPLERRVGPSQLWEHLEPPASTKETSNHLLVSWATNKPVQGAYYRFAWEFLDNRLQTVMRRYRELMKESGNHNGNLPLETYPQAKDCIRLSLVHHEPDFRSMYWFGSWHHFTPTQARCMELLWQSWEIGSPGVSGDRLLEEAESRSSRVSSIFRRSSAWNNGIIFSPRKGLYSLKPPSDLEECLSLPTLRR